LLTARKPRLLSDRQQNNQEYLSKYFDRESHRCIEQNAWAIRLIARFSRWEASEQAENTGRSE